MTASRRFDTTATSMSSNTTLVSTPHPPEPTSTSTRPCHSDSELDQRLDQRLDLTEREYTQKTRTTNPDVEKGLTPNDEKGWDGLTLPWKRRDGWRGWASDDLSTMALVPSLIVQAFSAGILDATTYADFKTFASNQTGNTILLTVSVLGHVQILLLLTGISLASFLFGALVFGHLGHYMGVKRRSWILTSTTYQITLLIIAAILVSPHGPTSTQIGSKHEWVILLFLANMSGAQVAMARQSGSQELPTAPMTSSFVDLMADRYLFVPFNHPKAGPRNRRLGYILAMVSGGFIGAVVHRFAGSWAVMLVTIFFKLVAMGLVSVAAPEKC